MRTEFVASDVSEVGGFGIAIRGEKLMVLDIRTPKMYQAVNVLPESGWQVIRAQLI